MNDLTVFNSSRGFRDKDFIETGEKLLFCVVSSTHPEDRVISYLKYMPSEDGRWGAKDHRFSRAIQRYTIPSLLETIDILRSRYPNYLFYSDVYHIEMSGVPVDSVVKHYMPERKLAEIMSETPRDPLIDKLIDLVEKLSGESGVPAGNFGVTGSILLDIYNPEFSDIDLTVYGYENSKKVKETILKEFHDRSSPIKRFDNSESHAWCIRKSREYPISSSDAERILERKWNMGIFRGVRFSINPVRTEEAESYGDRIYSAIGYGKIRAVVVEDREAIFTPSKYVVEEATILEGAKEVDVREITSYEGIYMDIAHEGEEIEARGKIELVEDKLMGETYHRILVGSLEGAGSDYTRILT